MTNSQDEPVRPQRLIQNERPAVSNFQPEHLLFRRCDPDHVVDGEVLPEAFRFPDLSVIRSVGPAETDTFAYDDALWVSAQDPPRDGRLYLPELAVVAFPVSAIPKVVPRENGDPYATAVVHTPYPDVFPHSDVRVYQGETHIVGRESAMKTPARRALREAIADRAIAVRRP